MSRPEGKVSDVRVSAYTVPTEVPEGDGTMAWSSTTCVVVEVDAAGQTGLGWTYGPTAVTDIVTGQLKDVVVGSDPLAVPGTWTEMVKAVRNSTRAGVAGYAISAVDVALWDLKARLLDLALADLFGRCRRGSPVYGSGGFTTFDDDRLTTQLQGWVEDQHIPRVKIKIGESWGSNVPRDLARMRRAREVIGPDTELYVDANGGYTAKQAIRVMNEVADADVRWYEEPVSSDDLAGLRLVREHVRADVAAGEYGTDATYFARMCAAGAVDCLQIDATRAGGYTAWFHSAAVAAADQLEVSAHCAPNLHVPATTATPNLRHIEYFADHSRIEGLLFDGALDPSGGVLIPDADRPGNGLRLNADRARAYRVR